MNLFSTSLLNCNAQVRQYSKLLDDDSSHIWQIHAGTILIAPSPYRRNAHNLVWIHAQILNPPGKSTVAYHKVLAWAHESDLFIHTVVPAFIFNGIWEIKLFLDHLHLVGENEESGIWDTFMDGLHGTIEVILAAYLKIFVSLFIKIASADRNTDGFCWLNLFQQLSIFIRSWC